MSGQSTPAFTADLGDGTYRNPVLNADWSDPDLIRVGDDYYLTASSFGRVPGLPLLHSRDLVNWTLVGHALQLLEPAREFRKPRHDRGVWAPSLRHHEDRFWIFWGDPDHGIYQINAPEIRGPWTRPHLVKAGRGLIDACPLWDEETGEAYLVHAWAKSRSGVKNRLTGHRMRPDATGLLDDGKVIVDGDRIPGWFTLEGPKLYRHDGWFWIFAPAGGVETGWQGALRSRDFFGPYEERVVPSRATPTSTAPTRAAGCVPRPASTGSRTSRRRARTGGSSTSSRCAGARTAGRSSGTRAPPSPYTASPICRGSRCRRPPPTTTSPAGGSDGSGSGPPIHRTAGRPSTRATGCGWPAYGRSTRRICASYRTCSPSGCPGPRAPSRSS